MVSFEEIASKTGGKSEFLDIDSNSGADRLTHLVTEQVLMNLGQSKGGVGSNLVDAYRQKYYN